MRGLYLAHINSTVLILFDSSMKHGWLGRYGIYMYGNDGYCIIFANYCATMAIPGDPDIGLYLAQKDFLFADHQYMLM